MVTVGFMLVKVANQFIFSPAELDLTRWEMGYEQWQMDMAEWKKSFEEYKEQPTCN